VSGGFTHAAIKFLSSFVHQFCVYSSLIAGAVAHVLYQVFLLSFASVFVFIIGQHQVTSVHFVVCFLFCFVSCLLFWLLVCACRSRWGPCMSHEALPGHTCNHPSFLPKELLLLCSALLLAENGQFSKACINRPTRFLQAITY
jgi:ABC-type transport system involved in multi-copper enzyme maturation permease subunit